MEREGSRSRSPIEEEPVFDFEKMKEERREHRDIEKQPDMKKRNSRVFGGLMSHLQKASKENMNGMESKSKIEKKVLEKLENDKNALQQLEKEKKAKQNESKKLQIEKEAQQQRKILEESIRKQSDQLSRFIRTKSVPCIYYMPVDHNDITAQLLISNVEWHERKSADNLSKLDSNEDS